MKKTRTTKTKTNKRKTRKTKPPIESEAVYFTDEEAEGQMGIGTQLRRLAQGWLLARTASNMAPQMIHLMWRCFVNCTKLYAHAIFWRTSNSILGPFFFFAKALKDLLYWLSIVIKKKKGIKEKKNLWELEKLDRSNAPHSWATWRLPCG